MAIQDRLRLISDPRSAAPLTMRHRHLGLATLLHVQGEIDSDTAPVLLDATNALTRINPPLALFVDLSLVSFFCAAGISALLRMRDLTQTRNTRLVLLDPSMMVDYVLGAVDLTDTFDIIPGTSGL